MADNGSPASPPFASPDGNPATPPATGPSKGVDFTTDPSGGKGTGGPGWLAEDRPQKKGTGDYNPDSIPSGGPILKADPGKEGESAGAIQGVGGARKPFKLTGGGGEGGGEAPPAGTIPGE